LAVSTFVQNLYFNLNNEITSESVAASGNDPDEQGDDPSGKFHGFWRLI
jgi:hypothetical protein